MKGSPRAVFFSMLAIALLASACGEDPVSHRRKMDDDMMAYKIRHGLVSTSTAATTVSVVSVSTSTVTITKTSN